MRWKSWVGPTAGNKRTVKYFAIWPNKLDDGFTVWLESYYAVETWDDGTTSTGFGYWKTIQTSSTHPQRPNTGSAINGH